METIRRFVLTGTRGFRAEISNYGAKILRLEVPDERGEIADVVLGFNTMEEWQSKEPYFNAIIGRVANRIKDGCFTLDGRLYRLPVYDGVNALHGGEQGFHARVWNVVRHDAHTLVLHYCAADGEEGYPGQLDVLVTYHVERTSLSIHYHAETDAPTLVNLTNHAYFNLNGEGSPTVRDHVLQVLADTYTPFDATACPTGEIASVAGSPMDFREPIRVGERIDDPFFALGNGIDNNWVLRKSGQAGEPELAAVLSSFGRTMEVLTTAPAMQVYTGNYVEANRGKRGAMYGRQNAICLEAQNIPDAVNHPHFPSPVLRPGEVYEQTTIYRFV